MTSSNMNSYHSFKENESSGKYVTVSETCQVPKVRSEEELKKLYEKKLDTKQGKGELLENIEAKFEYCQKILAIRRQEIREATEHYTGQKSKKTSTEGFNIEYEEMIESLNDLASSHAQLWWNKIKVPHVKCAIEENKEQCEQKNKSSSIVQGKVDCLEWKLKNEDLSLSIGSEILTSNDQKDYLSNAEIFKRAKIARFFYKNCKSLRENTVGILNDFIKTLNDINSLQISLCGLNVDEANQNFCASFDILGNTIQSLDCLQSLSLDLRQAKKTENILKALKGKTGKKLKYLELNLLRTDIKYESIKEFLDQTNVSKIKVFRMLIKSNYISNNIPDFAALLKDLFENKMKNLLYLDLQLSGIQINVSKLNLIFTYLPPRLIGFKLDLSETEIIHEDGKKLLEQSSLLRDLVIIDINLARAKISKVDISDMLNNFKDLKNRYFRIDLSNNEEVTDQIIEEWAKNPSNISFINCKLFELNLSNTQITDAAVEQLCNIPTLEMANCFKINLSYTGVTSNCMEIIKTKISPKFDPTIIINDMNIINNSFSWEANTFKFDFFNIPNEEI